MLTVRDLREALKPIIDRLRRLETQETPLPTPVPVIQSAAASGGLTLTGTPTDVPGCSLSLEPGEYLITGIFTVDGGTDQDNDAFAYFFGVLDVAGVDESRTANANLAWEDTRGGPAFVKGLWSISQQWHITVAVTTTVKLQAYKAGVFATGNSNISNAVITAIGNLA